MIDKKSIIKMANAIVRHDKGYPDRRLMHPRREWLIGLALFTGAVFTGSIFAGNVFVTYQNINTSEGDSGQSIPVYREAIAKEALEVYEARTKEYEVLRVATIPITSLEEEATSTEQVLQSSTETKETPPLSEESETSENLGEIELSF